MHTLKLSYILFLRGGWRTLMSMGIIYFALLVLSLTQYLEADSVKVNYLVVIWVIPAICSFADLNNIRNSDPLDLTHFIPFPLSMMDKFRKLVTLELTGVKLPLCLIYIILATLVYKLWQKPVVIVDMVGIYLAYNLAVIPVLQMVTRLKAVSVAFRAVGPPIFLIPVMLAPNPKYRKVFDPIHNWYESHDLLFMLILLGIMVASALSAWYFLPKIQLRFPFYSPEVVEVNHKNPWRKKKKDQ